MVLKNEWTSPNASTIYTAGHRNLSPTITDRDFTIATVAPPTVMKVEETVTEEAATDEVSDGSPEKGDDKEAEKKEDSSEDKSK